MPKDTATEIKPASEKNIAGYGLPPLAWDRALERLQEEWKLQAPPEMGGDASPHTHWLATTRPDGRPHVVGIGPSGTTVTSTSVQATPLGKPGTWHRTRIA